MAVAAFLVGAVGMYAETRASGNPAQSVAKAWVNDFQAKDLHGMSALFTANAVWEDGATGEVFTGGPAAEEQGWSDPFSSTRVKHVRILGMGDGVAIVAWTIFGPTPGHSSPINLPGISVLHVKDGRITRETAFCNTTIAYGH